jgi:hypothetical protein
LPTALPDFDGLEHLLFAAAAERNGGMLPSTSATCVRAVGAERLLPAPLLSTALQRNYIADLGFIDPLELGIASECDATSPDMRAFPRGISRYQLGELILFGKQGNHDCYLARGWSTTEEEWVWIEGLHAALLTAGPAFPCANNTGCSFVLDAQSLPPAQLDQQGCTICINGTELAELRFIGGARCIFVIHVPDGLIHSDEPLQIDLRCRKAAQPPGESRLLSMRVFSVSLQPTLALANQTMVVLDDGFDEARYLTKNPDVAAGVFSGSVQSGYEHFIRYGLIEHRGF